MLQILGTGTFSAKDIAQSLWEMIISAVSQPIYNLLRNPKFHHIVHWTPWNRIPNTQ